MANRATGLYVTQNTWGYGAVLKATDLVQKPANRSGVAVGTCTSGRWNPMHSFMSLSWGSPIGLGIFLAGVGVFFWGFARMGWHRHKEN